MDGPFGLAAVDGMRPDGAFDVLAVRHDYSWLLGADVRQALTVFPAMNNLLVQRQALKVAQRFHFD